MNKELATQEIADKLEIIYKLIEECTEIAEAADIPFTFRLSDESECDDWEDSSCSGDDGCEWSSSSEHC